MLSARKFFQHSRRWKRGFSSHVDIGGIKLPVKEPQRPDLVPKGVVAKWGTDILVHPSLGAELYVSLQ